MLIKLQSQDLDPSGSDLQTGRATKRFNVFMVAKMAIAAVFVVVFVFTPAAYTHAGVFSFLSDLFSERYEAAVDTRELNSQNMALLQAALNSDPNPSKGGGDITIVGGSALLPDSGPLGTIVDVENAAPKTGQISLYVVREGDSLSQIAKMFDVSTNTIIWANDIKRGDLIHVGQTLVILPVTGVRYTVKGGDTIGSIAKKYKGHAEEIMEFNGVADASELTVGQIIVIPDGEIGTPTYSPRRTASIARGTGGPEYHGYYMAPVNGRRTQGLHGYNGIDIGAPVGTPVVASASGNVIISRGAGWNGGYGKYIVVSHSNNTQTLYAHLSGVAVPAGVWVVQGQIIGYAGSTGRSTGPHLHFEVRGAKNPF